MVVRRLYNIREAEEKLARWILAQSAEDPQPMAKQPETPSPAHTEGRGDTNGEKWKLLMARISRMKSLPLKRELPLKNRFTTLKTEEEGLIMSGDMLALTEAALSAPHRTTNANKKRQGVIVVSESFLRAPVC